MKFLNIYHFPLYYDIAFQYRDIPLECDFIELMLEKQAKTENRLILDIACGSGMHIVELGRRGYTMHGFDLSPEMIDFSTKKCKEIGLSPLLWVDDMRNFTPRGSYGMAINMLTTFNYLTDNDDIVAHLRRVAEALSPGGIYLIELHHPRDFSDLSASVAQEWMESRGDITVECSFDYQPEATDPITQIRRNKVRFEVTEGEVKKVFEEEQEVRVVLFQEFNLFLEFEGSFELVAANGAFREEQPLDNSEDSWRMILTLRKKL